MQKEIEVKILNVNEPDIRRKLSKLGAKKVFGKTLFHEILFQLPGRGAKFDTFRLRQEFKKVCLTLKLKKKAKGVKMRDEFEVEVGDFEMMKKILLLAGFVVEKEREKWREEWKLGKIKIEIDTYPKMNPYIEIEAVSRKEIESFVKKLGYAFSQTTPEPASNVLKSHGLDPNYLMFKK